MNSFNIALSVIFDPVEAFRIIQRKRSKFSHVPTSVLLFLVVAVRILAIYITHYPLAAIDPRDTNIGREIANTLLPIITIVVGCYLVTTIYNGEAMFREIFQAGAYSMLPFIIFTVPIALLSNIMVSTDVAFVSFISDAPYTYISAFQTIIWIWVGLLFLISLSQMNSYGFFETIKVAIIAILTCIFMWAVLSLFYILGNNVIDFISDVAYQYRIYFFGI